MSSFVELDKSINSSFLFFCMLYKSFVIVRTDLNSWRITRIPIITKTVVNGGTVDEPIVDLGFCQRVKYDKSLANVTDDMIINVTIDNTYKYVFMGGCLAALVGSIVVIVIIIFKTLNIEDDDEDDIEFDAPKENNVE